MKKYFARAYVKTIGDKEGLLQGIIGSTSDVDRYHEKIDQSTWDLTHFRKNPVILWAHNLSSGEDRPPIARAENVQVLSDKLQFDIQFDMADPFAADIYRKYKEKFLNAFSVGYIPHKVEVSDDDQEVPVHKNCELFELSCVPVPANPAALASLRQRSFKTKTWDKLMKEVEEDEAETKAAIPYKKTPMADKEQAWDGPAQMAACGDDMMAVKAICAWFDSENPDVKSSYKLPHHMASGEYAVVWNGVKAAMSALLGGRGGVDMPDADRKAVYNHLAKHYADFDETPPEFKSVESESVDLDAVADKVAEKIMPSLTKNITDAVSEAMKRSPGEGKGGTSDKAPVKTKQGTESHLVNLIRETTKTFQSALAEVNAQAKK